MMATEKLTRAATAPMTRSHDLAPPLRVYARDDSSAERGSVVPLQNMQGSEVRNRRRHESHIDDSPTVSSKDELTSQDHAATEGDQPQQPPLWTRFGRLICRLWPQPLSQTKTSQPPKRKAQYDKVKHQHLEEDYVQGLPRLAALQDSNESVCMFRRFGDIAARILIAKEIELDQLACQLKKLDKEDNENPAMRWRLKSVDFYEGCDPTQRNLLHEIEQKLNEYYDFLMKYVDVRGLSPVDPRHHRNIHTWMIDNPPLYEGEDSFLFSVDDFITARRKPENGTQHGSKIADALESYISKRPNSRLHAFIKGEAERRKTSNPRIHHFSRSSLGILERIVASSLAVGTMLIPVLILYLFDLSRGKMAALVVCFVLLFMGTFSIFVEVTPHDLFIGVAAFSAVLVALLSNLAQGSGPGSPSTWPMPPQGINRTRE